MILCINVNPDEAKRFKDSVANSSGTMALYHRPIQRDLWDVGKTMMFRQTCGTVGKNCGVEAVEDVADKRLCRSVVQLFLENRRPSSVKFINICSETVASDGEEPKWASPLNEKYMTLFEGCELFHVHHVSLGNT